MTKQIPDTDTLRQLLHFIPETGRLFWRERGPEWFTDGRYPAARSAASWNTRYAGKEAFTSIDGTGYRQGSIFNHMHRAHRVIWRIVHGVWPQDTDHINGIRTDNRIVNLRNVSRTENMRNAARPNTNTSGSIGVGWDRSSGKWQAQITVDGRNRHLSYFSDKADAIAARKAAEIEHGFHENHGRLV